MIKKRNTIKNIKHDFEEIEHTFIRKRWNDALERSVQLATLVSIALLAASSLPNINQQITKTHPMMIHLLLIGALLLVFCASAVLISAFVKKQKYTYKILNDITRIAAVIGMICFFLGGVLAVMYLVF